MQNNPRIFSEFVEEMASEAEIKEKKRKRRKKKGSRRKAKEADTALMQSAGDCEGIECWGFGKKLRIKSSIPEAEMVKLFGNSGDAMGRLGAGGG